MASNICHEEKTYIKFELCVTNGLADGRTDGHSLRGVNDIEFCVVRTCIRQSCDVCVFVVRCPVLLITGQKSIFNATTRSLHQAILKHCPDKGKVEFIEVAGVANVLEEKVRHYDVLLHLANGPILDDCRRRSVVHLIVISRKLSKIGP